MQNPYNPLECMYCILPACIEKHN